MSGSLDDIEDAMDALRRLNVSFLVCVRRKVVSNDAEDGVVYRVEGELHGEEVDNEWGAIKTAVSAYCDEAES